MKTCKKCQKEFDENLTYCPFCGAENADKKLTYIERKQAREKDTEVILNKASIQQSDIENAESIDPSELILERFTALKKTKLNNLTAILCSLASSIIFIVFAYIISNKDINSNLKLITILVAFIAVAVMASIFISSLYTYTSLNKMKTEDFSIKKIYFTKGPIMYFKGDIYEIKTYKMCDKCNNKMHVEMVDETLFLVCDTNRSHLYKIEKDAYIAHFREKLSK